MTAIDRYFESAEATLAEVAATQAETLETAARLVADSVAAGGVLHLFGAGHSQLVALDAFRRAGGLACVNPIVDPALAPAAGPDVSRVERTPGHAATVLDGEDLRSGEVVVVVSNSGVNPVPVEVALGCRERGLQVVALTNVEQAKATAARHASGAKLHELADVVVDNRCPVGDAAVTLAGGDRVGPMSTVVGAAVIAALAARVAELLLDRGATSPVLVSQNLDGRDATERNQQLLRAYRGRTRLPL
ncbi:MAG TPA: sugar isomerase domain-containing protein [Actinomycetota bacterium]|nr:sugar isomerase domain-containing protein [Actinomycetota bacterium]